MADPFGISFSPTGQGGAGQPNGARPSPIQQAIQTLSFKIPRVAGASAFTAQPLLTAPGGAGLGGNPNSAALLEQIRRMLFGDQQQGSQQQQQQGGGMAPASNFSQLFGMPPAMGAPGAPSMGAPSPSGGGGIPLPHFDPGSTPPRDPDPGFNPPPLPPPDPTPTEPTMASTPYEAPPQEDPRDRWI